MALLRIGPQIRAKVTLREGRRSAGRKDTVYAAVVSGEVVVPSSQPLFAIVGGRPCWTWHSLRCWLAWLRLPSVSPPHVIGCWVPTSPCRRGNDDDPDGDHSEESPPCHPVLLGLPNRRDHSHVAQRSLLSKPDSQQTLSVRQFVRQLSPMHRCASMCTQCSDLRKQTPVHGRAPQKQDWGSSGRRFKSCQPDRETPL